MVFKKEKNNGKSLFFWRVRQAFKFDTFNVLYKNLLLMCLFKSADILVYTVIIAFLFCVWIFFNFSFFLFYFV